MALVIRGHLYVENALIEKIEDALKDPTAFDSAELHFPAKVSLAVALGTVDRADVGAFTALNRLRVIARLGLTNPRGGFSTVNARKRFVST